MRLPVVKTTSSIPKSGRSVTTGWGPRGPIVRAGKYHYGENDDHVLFGDWQICFQTYVDLYNVYGKEYMVKRGARGDGV